MSVEKTSKKINSTNTTTNTTTTMNNKTSSKYTITERSVVDYINFLTKRKKNVPYVMIYLPLLNRNDLTLREKEVYAIIYNIISSKFLAYKISNPFKKDDEEVDEEKEWFEFKYAPDTGVTFKEIYQSIEITKGMLSKVIQNLEDAKLIKVKNVKTGCIVTKKISLLYDMSAYDDEFAKEVEKKCKSMIEEGQNTIDFGMKTINVEKALQIVEEDNTKRGIGRRKRNNTNKVGTEVEVNEAEVNDINDTSGTNGTSGTNNVSKKKIKNGVVGIAKEVQSIEEFENENEDTKTETVNKKVEAESKKADSNKSENKSETKPKQEVEVHDDAYYEELFNSVEF